MAMSRSGTAYLERAGILTGRIIRSMHGFESAKSHFRPVRTEPVLLGGDCPNGRLRTVEKDERAAYKGRFDCCDR